MKGIFNILLTPFDNDGEVDETSLRNLVDFQISAGADGLTIVAIHGEGGKLTDSEWASIVDTVIDQTRDRIPVVVTVSHQSTKVVINRTGYAAKAGAAAIMAAPPAMLRNLDSVSDFYRTLTAASSIPIVVQDEPANTEVILPASFLANVGHPMIKLEEPPVPQKLTKILEQNPSAQVFGGLGGQYFMEELERGAVGTMTGFALTEVLVSIYNDFNNGNRQAARETFQKHLNIIRFEGQKGVGLAIRKEIMRRRGVIKSSEIRSPGMRMDAQSHDELTRILEEINVATV